MNAFCGPMTDEVVVVLWLAPRVFSFLIWDPGDPLTAKMIVLCPGVVGWAELFAEIPQVLLWLPQYGLAVVPCV